MAESPLSLGYGDIVSDVGHYLGYSRTSSNHTSDQTTEIEAIMDSGLRQFYSAHPNGWSFMKLTGTITFVSGTSTYDLADDFGSLRGPFTWPADSGYAPPEVTSAERIRALNGQVSLNAPPTLVAVYPKTFAATTGERWQAEFYPTPDSTETMTYRYNVLPSYRMRSATPYPYGGQDHAETIKFSCLARAEIMMNHAKGVMHEEYERLLDISLRRDALQGPSNIGTNGDGSDDKGDGNYRFDYTANTYNGTAYD